MNCVGVIFHFNPDGVLFEFRAGKNDDAVGIVKPKDIKINSKETVPANATTVDQISKFIQVGDELLCSVEQRGGSIEKFVYNEEEEEVGADGKVKVISRKVEIQPRWVAKSAELVTDANRNKRDEIANSSDKSHDGLAGDYNDDDDLILIEDVDMSEFAEDDADGGDDGNLKKSTPTKPAAADKTVKTGLTTKAGEAAAAKAAAPAAAPRQIVKILAPASKANEAKATVGGSAFHETYFARARLVQLRKPPVNSAGKVTTAIFEISAGKFKGRKVSVPSMKMLCFGHPMTSANLMTSLLKCGEECTVEFRVVKLKASQDFLAELNHSAELVEVPLVVRLWLGKQTDTPVSSSDRDFEVWLREKKISAKEFQNWIKNWVSPKPYLPFVGETKICKVVRYIRAGPDAAVVGVFVEVTGDRPNQGSSVAILLNHDFYVCGVCVLHADLSIFLKLGDSLNCEVRPLTNGDAVLLQPYLFGARDLKVTRVADLGMVGPTRPTQANLAPAHAPMLDKYLTSKGLTMSEFESMRYKTSSVMEFAPPASPFVPQGFAHLMRPPMMPPGPFGPPPFGMRPMMPGPMMPRPGVPGTGPSAQPEPGALPPPPNGLFPGVFGPFVPQVPPQVVHMATNLAARAVNIDADDMRIRNLLHNPAEMEVAAKIAKNLTQSLIHKLQSNVQSRLNSSLPTLADLKKQQQELDKLQQDLKNQNAGQAKEPTPPVAERPSAKRAGSVPSNDGFSSKQARMSDKPSTRLGPVEARAEQAAVGGVRSRLGPPPMQNLNAPPPAIAAAPLGPLPVGGTLPPIQPVSAQSQLNPLPLSSSTLSQQLQQPSDAQLVNPFHRPTESDANRWSPTYVRFQEMGRFNNGAQQQAREPSFREQQTLEEVARKDRQLQEELEQQKIWEEYVREKEARIKREEEERARAAEEVRKREREAEEMKRFLEEQEMLRQKMMLAQKEEEEKRIRKQQEEERRLREEQERARMREEFEKQQRAREEQERKRKEEEGRQRFLAEQERKRKEEQERKRREEEERQRRFREEQERKRKEEQERQRIRAEIERQRVLEEQERKRKEEMERQRVREEQERRRKEELERQQRAREEQERKRKAELEIQRVREEQERLFREELEKVREEERERARKAVEQERLRIREEEMRRLKLQKEEEEAERARLQEQERQQEMLWRSEMEKKLRKQQEEDERERKARETFANLLEGASRPSQGYADWMNNPPPPPKLTGAYSGDSRAKPEGPPGFRKSDVFGDRVPFRSGSLEKSDPRDSGAAAWNQFGPIKNPGRMGQQQQEGNRDRQGQDSGQRPGYGAPPPPYIAGREKSYERRY